MIKNIICATKCLFFLTKIDIILEYINSDDHIIAEPKYIFCFKHTQAKRHNYNLLRKEIQIASEILNDFTLKKKTCIL